MNFEVTTSQLIRNKISGKESMKPYLYMINANSFGEAEKIMIKFLKDNNRKGTVDKIEHSQVSQVDKVDKKYFYKVKINTLIIDDNTGKEKYVPYYHLISSDKPEEAIKVARTRFDFSDEYSIDHTIKRPFIDILNY